ncbi:MAG: O-antigen ligase domain-containing protein [Steroidobacteraceae bacterium]
MSSSAIAVRTRRGVPSLTQVQVGEQRVRRRVGIAYSLLFFNTLTFYPGIAFVHIPSAVGKGLAQAVLPVAQIVALTVNPKVIVRPNVFLCLVSLLVLGALITTLQPQHFGTVYRTFRLAGFVAGLWLLTPWWGRRDLLLVRCHLRVLMVLLGSVLLGLLISPGHARVEGRLSGAIWPIPPPQVAHYSAVTVGLVIVLWFCGKLSGRITLVIVTLATATLLLTHTRTALVGMVAGILVAGLSLVVAKARVRKLFAIAGAVAGVAILTLSGVITTWLARGQGTQEIFKLTGRTTVWSALLTFPRNKFQEIFGFGLSNSSFNGLPIDSNWLASYQEQGLYGVVICAVILFFLLVTSYFQPRGVQRALALFLVTYCLLASFTEVGFTDVSAYLLDLTLAASLIVPPVAMGRRPA